MDQQKPEQHVSDLRILTKYLDSKYQLPGGIKIGWDGIIGFIPGLGDMITNSLSFYIIVRGAMLGCPPSVIMRMGLNVIVDNLVDIIPVLGNFFDILWKANTRNMALIDQHMTDPKKAKLSARIAVTLALSFVALMMILTLTVVLFAAIWVWEQLSIIFSSI